MPVDCLNGILDEKMDMRRGPRSAAIFILPAIEITACPFEKIQVIEQYAICDSADSSTSTGETVVAVTDWVDPS